MVRSATLVGTMEDALGNKHEINERINLWEVWEITKVSSRRLPPDYQKQTADSIREIRDELRKLGNVAQNAYYRTWPPKFDNEEEAA